jgi:hypothetical protein
VTDADRLKLLFGPCKAPALRRGDRDYYRRGRVVLRRAPVITAFARNPWQAYNRACEQG